MKYRIAKIIKQLKNLIILFLLLNSLKFFFLSFAVVTIDQDAFLFSSFIWWTTLNFMLLLKLISFLVLLFTLLQIHSLILAFTVCFLQVLRSDEFFFWSKCLFWMSIIRENQFLSSSLLHLRSKRDSFHQLKIHISFSFNCENFVTWIAFVNIFKRNEVAISIFRISESNWFSLQTFHKLSDHCKDVVSLFAVQSTILLKIS